MSMFKTDNRTASLLLLPALEPATGRSTLRIAYGKALDTVLHEIAPSDRKTTSVLDIAVVLPTHKTAQPRTTLYPEIHKIVLETYTLICLSAARCKVDLDFPGGVDARVILLRGLNSNNPLSASPPTGQVDDGQGLSGLLVDAHAFVNAKRAYKTVYSLEGETNESLLRNFDHMWRTKHKTPPSITRLPAQASLKPLIDAIDPPSKPGSATDVHRSVCVGGTFDHLHLGHKLLLSATAFIPEPPLSPYISASTTPEDRTTTLVVGISEDALLASKKYASVLESWDERCAYTAAFLESILVFHPDIPSIRQVEHINDPGPNRKIVRVTYTTPPPPSSSSASAPTTKDHSQGKLIIDYTHFSDPCGPTITVQNLTSLAISAETRAGGAVVNQKRSEKGWNALEIFEVDVLDSSVADDDDNEEEEKEVEVDAEAKKKGFESKISSTDIRRRLEELKTKL